MTYHVRRSDREVADKQELLSILLRLIYSLFLLLICSVFFFCEVMAPPEKKILPWEPTLNPPLGWNSYTGYGWLISDSIARANLDVFSQKYVPCGYNYFVVDDGWQGHPYQLTDAQGQSVTMFEVAIDSFGRCLPDPDKFPHGLQPLIETIHAKGLRFGVWIIRGAPIKAARQNFSIKGTSMTFRQELDTNQVIEFVHGSYRFRNGSPGMQAYYNSVFELLAGWGVDFVKYDWITDAPDEISAVINALAGCGRRMVLSLSPNSTISMIEAYRQADMVRITSDVWDDRASLEKGFDAWYTWSSFAQPGFWIDLDMISFGAFPGFGRSDTMTTARKKTFMTQRALAASPLIMGGALPELDSISCRLTTDLDMLACNQNGICGKLVKKIATIEIWKTCSSSSSDTGWIGIFNRSLEPATINLTKEDIGLNQQLPYNFFDIWEKKQIPDANISGQIEQDGVVFIRYRKNG
jgi:alpha-galactosidase